MRQIKVVAVITLALLFAVGCTNPLNLGGGGTPKGPQYDTITGVVTFHDTDIPIKADVKFGPTSFTTGSGGAYQVELETGKTYTWTVSTLVSDRSGSYVVDGDAVFNIDVYAFPGWSRKHFNELLITPEAGNRTVRWADGKVVKYWIQSPQDNPNIQAYHVGLAHQAVGEWKDILSGAITFERVTKSEDADLRIKWDRHETIGGYAGMCTFYWNSDYSLKWGDVTIAYRDKNGTYTADNIGLMRHEIGHCIGLGHSSDKTLVMYPVVGSSNQEISLLEQRMARLTYSIPVGTKKLEETGFVFSMGSTKSHETYTPMPDGGGMKTFYTPVE